MANPNNKYAVAAKAALEELGGALTKSGVLVKYMQDKGLVEGGVNAYNYTLKACKESDVFNTSKRGHIGLAAVVPVEPAAVQEAVVEGGEEF